MRNSFATRALHTILRLRIVYTRYSLCARMKGFNYSPPPDGLPRGPKPKPSSHIKQDRIVTSALTVHEWEALEAFRLSVPGEPTRSQMVRHIVRAWLQQTGKRRLPGLGPRFGMRTDAP